LSKGYNFITEKEHPNEQEQFGYPNINTDKLMKAEGHYAGDLVSLDFKSEELYKFLENVVVLVNQHSQKINQMEMDKVNVERIRVGNEKMVEASRLPPNVMATLPTLSQKNKIETYEDTIEAIANHMKLNAHCISDLIFSHPVHLRLSQKERGAGQCHQWTTGRLPEEGRQYGGAEEDGDHVQKVY
jgi:hypothetical protein